MDTPNFDFNFDYSQLSAVALQADKITHREIRSVFSNAQRSFPLAGFSRAQHYYFIIGFSSKKRFLLVALNYSYDNIVFHRVAVADEKQIQQYFCQ